MREPGKHLQSLPHFSSYSDSWLKHSENYCDKFEAISDGGIRINGGFFIFKKEVFDHIQQREELAFEPFQRVVEKKQLIGYPHDSF
jgi:glucose-1-phosphate cytidylyltransferase